MTPVLDMSEIPAEEYEPALRQGPMRRPLLSRYNLMEGDRLLEALFPSMVGPVERMEPKLPEEVPDRRCLKCGEFLEDVVFKVSREQMIAEHKERGWSVYPHDSYGSALPRRRPCAEGGTHRWVEVRHSEEALREDFYAAARGDGGQENA